MSDEQAIIDLETSFWDTMVAKDVDAATAMMSDESLVTGPQGVAKISKGDFAKMMSGSKWTLERYRFSDVHVIFPADGLAVIGYKVSQEGTMDGKGYSFEAADATTWERSDGQWKCVLHTESTLGNPFG
jgi:ketosteroid isomerase-like protein